MTRINKICLIIFASLCLVSCGRKLIYFQEKEDSKNKFNNIEVIKPEDTRSHIIEAGDILGFKANIQSKEINDEFQHVGSNLNGVTGILVQENGTIFLPYTGSIKIAGKSIKVAQTIIISELSKYIVNPNLELTLISFRITIIGEIKAPGPKNSPGDRMTLIDALALSGDMTSDGRRTNIKVLRQIGDKKVTTIMDITSLDVFRSETFYLKSNDIIYIESLPRKFFRENYSYVTIVLSLTNTLLIWLTIIK